MRDDWSILAVMGKQDTKQTLLDTGRRLMLAKGFHHAGLQEIVRQAGVPKGSFYHFFPSKEAFGLAVLEDYVEEFEAFLTGHLQAPDVPPRQRLRNFFTASRERLLAERCEGGCLVGNLAQELADQDDVFRGRLAAVLAHWEAQFATCLAEAVRAGELSPNADTRKMARFILDGWEGAILRMKVTKEVTPIDDYIDVLFSTVLA